MTDPARPRHGWLAVARPAPEMMALLLPLLAFCHTTAAATSVIEVAARPGELNRVVDAIAASDATTAHGTTLRLAAGRHQLLRPLELGAAHSGLRFAGASGAAPTVISGGLEIPPSSWTVFAAHPKCAGCGSVMRAPLAAGTNYSRQLYVNGQRANWTMGLFPQQGAKITATGYSVPTDLKWEHNQGAKIEMVYRGTHSSGAQWTESRNPATGYEAAAGGGGHITMAAAGFAAGNNKAYNQHLTLPEYYQNVFELLGEAEGGKPGDWCDAHYWLRLAACLSASLLAGSCTHEQPLSDGRTDDFRPIY